MKRLLLVLFGLFATQPVLSQVPPKYEFRGVWIATVANLDWPLSPTEPAEVQQSRLKGILASLKSAGVNAVIFQVRTEADALFASETEPWSYWLTGQQGVAPDPFYDPLAFAIEEAHALGMELHAWFNPYRVIRGSGYPNSADHVSQEHPEWLLAFNALRVLDPGLPEVRAYVTDVIADVAGRYDIDGVHFDDYFYPYPPNQISNEDAATFKAYSRGFTDIGAWRRDNVDLLVEAVHDTLQVINPDIVFGISPFGIWKNGVPAGIVGLDAYNVIFADATTWLDAGTVDYIAPQLYWSFGAGQDYGKLAPWWASVANGRHVYPGHGLYRSERATFSGTLFSASQIPNQVRFNRATEGIDGSIFFRAKNITTYSSKGFADTLRTDLYRHPALPPVMGWKSEDAPATPENLAFEWDDETVTLTWSPSSSSAADSARFFSVYRIQSATVPDYETALVDARNLLFVTGDTTLTDRPVDVGEPYYYVVRGVSANSIESPPSNAVVLEGRAVDAEEQGAPLAFELGQNYPNPFESRTTMTFSLDRPGRVTLRVYDVLGRTVATLAEDAAYPAGPHAVEWDGATASGRPLVTGTYFYQLEMDGSRETKSMTVIR